MFTYESGSAALGAALGLFPPLLLLLIDEEELCGLSKWKVELISHPGQLRGLATTSTHLERPGFKVALGLLGLCLGLRNIATSDVGKK
jgi:hypothetical protein